MNQSNLSNPKEFSAGQPKQAAAVIRIALIIFATACVVEALYLYLAWQMSAWQMVAMAGVTAVFCVSTLLAVGIIRSGKLETGSWLIIIGMLLVFPASGALVSNVGLLFGEILILLTLLVVANQALPSNQARRAIIASILLGIFTATLDLLGLEYRLFFPEIQTFVPAITGVILLIIVLFAIRQYWSIISGGLQLKVAVWTGSILAGVAIILIAYSTITARQLAIVNAQNEALAIASAQARQVRADTEIPLDTARALAQAFTAIKDPASNASLSRDQVNAMLRQVLIENPSYLGTYTLWEPNAFDGLDAKYSGTEAHDISGRFIPYWVHDDNGSVKVIALIDYETPGLGDWYILPRQTKKEVTIAPLIYPLQGVDTVMASFVVPIIFNGNFYGIAGIDAPISFVQNIVDSVDLYSGKAEAFLMTSSGTLISVRNKPELVNQPATQIFSDFSDLQTRIEAGNAFTSFSPDGQYLRIFAPVELGKTGTHWIFGLIIPFSVITSPANTSAVLQGAIGLVLILLALALLWFLSGQIVRPVLALITVANAVSQGNLNVKAQVLAADETGVLANTFNLMIGQLQNLFSTLEQRVAERTRGLVLAAEVGRSVSQVRALDVMLKDAVEIIRSQYDLYYAQVYLTNPSQTELILQAGTGSVGAELLGREHHLSLNTGSINGRAAIEKRSVVISDTTTSATFRPNPLLPNTRSEMAIPLFIGEKVVGVLDMQSTLIGALSQESLPAFEALAGQLAVTIQNASLLAETERARAEVEGQARRLVRAGWDEYMDAIHKPEQTGFVFEKNQILPLSNPEEFKPADGVSALLSSISVSGEELGELIVELEAEKQTPQTVELVNIVARQVAQQIENLRLLESAERYRAEAEETSRRLTREGWKNYTEANADTSMGFIYDLNEVRAHHGNEDQVAESSSVTLPIKVREETVGKFVVQSIQALDSESISFANAVAERLGAHIESLRQFDETRRGQIELDKRARQLAAVAEISSVSSRELNIEKMLQSVVHLTQRQFGLYHAHVFTYNENTSALQIAACGWKAGDEHEGTHGTTSIPLALEQSLVARAARNRQAVIVNDVHIEAGWLPNPLLPETHSEMAVPLIIGDQILGVLDVQSDHINAFSEDDANIYTTLASQVSTALQNARSFVLAQKQAERETTLNVISQKIQSATSVEAVLQIAARELGHALGSPRTIAQLSVKDRN